MVVRHGFWSITGFSEELLRKSVANLAQGSGPGAQLGAMLAFEISSVIGLARLYVPQLQSVVYPAFSVSDLSRSALRGPVVARDLVRLAFGQSSEGMACAVQVWVLSSSAVFGAFVGWVVRAFVPESVGDSKRLRRPKGTVATLPDIQGWPHRTSTPGASRRAGWLHGRFLLARLCLAAPPSRRLQP